MQRVAKKKFAVHEVNKKESVRRGRIGQFSKNGASGCSVMKAKLLLGTIERFKCEGKVTKNTTPNTYVPLRKFSVVNSGCVCFQGVGTFTYVKGIH